MDLAGYIELTRLKPDTSRDEVVKLCHQAVQNGFFGVCIPPFYVGTAHKVVNELKSPVKIITVVGFPFGYERTSAKVEEVKQALRDGADEIDAVVNLAALKSGDMSAVENDISSIVTTCQMQNKKAKLIFETNLLNEAEVAKLCEITVKTGADFVKTSTGMLPGGVTVETVAMLRKLLPEKVLIKAAGGIRSHEQAVSMINAGATRIGTSNWKRLMEIK